MDLRMTSSPRDYQFNPTLRIWETAAHPGSSYSDGEDVEQRLLATLRNCSDVSVLSEELHLHMTDWPSEYHFSPERSSLLRPFSIGSKDCVLELGCGCGAITRYLGETGATVIAVEGSRRRASIATERCRDLPNVSIYCDNLQHFQTDMRFSHVTLIGVMEYARLFMTGDEPELQCLQRAAQWLGEDGQLVLAIENQFGLKYFNGCAEDHVGTPGFGLHDLYTPDSVVTFGHHDLQQLFLKAGLPAQEWIYPLPDYKLPTHLIHSRALSQPGFAMGDLLHSTCARDYTGRRARVFHEGMAWRGLARNQMLPALANSFLISARRAPHELNEPAWLAASFSLKRRAVFCTQTKFVAQADGSIEVCKQRLADVNYESALAVSTGLEHAPASGARYVSGSLHAATFQRLAACARTLDDLHLWLQQWLAFLRSEQSRAGLGSTELPGHLLDAIPGNLIDDANGQLQLIDAEWRMTSPIPMNWVLIRGMVMTLTAAPPVALWNHLTFQQVTTQLMQLVGISLRQQDFVQAAQLNDALQQQVHPHRPGTVRFGQVLSVRVHALCGDISSGHGERALQNEVDRIKSTFSWQITKPLRLLAFLWRKLAG
jgi:SAM-dependent methyltransferase